MLKSRRGLLAAGLAVAVVGALGVVSTLNAGAEEIPANPDASTSASPGDVHPALRPPPNLPWGSRPKPVRKGRAGADASTLHAAGLDAAPADTSGSEQPDPKFAPKGRSAEDTSLKSETTDVPPQPAAAAATAPTPASTVGNAGANRAYFMYGDAAQTADVDGFFASLTIAKPTLATSDYHTLAEVAVESADGNQIVEVGWNVDRSVNGDADPHLFVYHWVNLNSSCYNACGFVQSSPNVKPGDTLNYGNVKKFGIQFFNGGWWVAFDSEWIGYFPATIWSDQGVQFTKGGYQQVFGEVAASSTSPCVTQMGTGVTPTASLTADGSALVTSMGYVNGPAVAMDVKALNGVYSVQSLNSKTFRYGGPGNGC